MKSIFAVLLLGAFATGLATAQNKPNYNDTVNCRWKDGRDMSEKDCEFFRKLKASDEAEEAAYQARSQARLNKQREDREAQEQIKAERLAADKKEREDRHELEKQKNQTLAQQWALDDAKRDKEERQQQAKQQALQADLKRRCGDDYLAPKIGMTATRLSECVPALKLYSQLNRADGVVSIYTGRGLMVHLLGGQVVAWSRL